MKRLIYFFFAAAMMLSLSGCNDDPDFIKNAPPSSGETDGTDDDSDAGGDGTVEGVDPNFQIYLCFGQSNMEGFASLDGTYNGIEDKDKTVDERFQVLNVVSGSWNGVQREVGHWYTAVPPLCRSNTGLCPADYFGRTMVEELSKTNPDIKVGVIVVAIGGAGIRAFHKTEYASYYNEMKNNPNSAWLAKTMDIYGGNPYATLVNMARIAQKQGVIKGILMHQGESDGCGPEWRQDVAEIYKDLISDLSLKSENTPLLVGELLNDDNQGLGKDRNSELPKIKELVPNTYVVPSKGCTVVDASKDPDNAGNNRYLHFSSEGYRELGRHYAQVMLSVLAGQKPDEPEEEPIGPTDPKDLFKIEEGKFKNLSTYHVPDVAIDYGSKTVSNIGDYGVAGWQFATPVNLKGQGFLVAKFTASDDAVPFLCIGNMDAYGEAYAQYESTNKDGYYYSVIDLKNDLVSNVNKDKEYSKGTVYLEKLTMVGLQCPASGKNHSFTIESVYVTDKNPLEEGEGEVPSEPTPVEDLFKLEASSFKKMSGHENTIVEFNESKAIVKNAGNYGVIGWDFSTSPINLEGKGYLVVELSEYVTELPWIVICDKGLYGEGYKTEKATEKEGKYYVVLSLKSDPDSNIPPNDKTERDYSIDLSNLTYVGLQSGTSENELPNGGYTVDKVYFSSTNPLKQ